jgi:hypothetical protein
MLTLGDFKILLRRAHKRGAALDDDLNGAIRRAAHWIEKNYTLQYMRRRYTVELESGENEIDVPDIRIKAFISPITWNTYDTTGEWAKCPKISFDDIQVATRYTSYSSVPAGFYLDGVEKMVFDRTYSGAETLVGTGFISRFSDFPIEDDETHWLFEFGEAALLTQSMLELGVVATRDDRQYQMYLTHRSDQMQVLLNADTETQYSGTDISL